MDGELNLRKLSKHRYITKFENLPKETIEDIHAKQDKILVQAIVDKPPSNNDYGDLVMDGYYQDKKSGTQIYMYHSKDSDDGKRLLNIKGDNHPLIKTEMNFYDRRHMMINMNRMFGFKVYGNKDKGWCVKIPKSDRKFSNDRKYDKKRRKKSTLK